MRKPLCIIGLFLLVSCGINNPDQTTLPHGYWAESESADSGTSTLFITVVGDSFYCREIVKNRLAWGTDINLRNFKASCTGEIIEISNYRIDTLYDANNSSIVEQPVTVFKCGDSIYDPTVSASYGVVSYSYNMSYYAKGILQTSDNNLTLEGYCTDSLFTVEYNIDNKPTAFQQKYKFTISENTLILIDENSFNNETKYLVKAE